jgi:hypothetical protein
VEDDGWKMSVASQGWKLERQWLLERGAQQVTWMRCLEEGERPEGFGEAEV